MQRYTAQERTTCTGLDTMTCGHKADRLQKKNAETLRPGNAQTDTQVHAHLAASACVLARGRASVRTEEKRLEDLWRMDRKGRR